MRKSFFALLLALIFGQFATAQTAVSKDTTHYNYYAYMKVKPGMYDDYLKLEKAWKKIHLANKKAGKLHDWSLAEMISPSGASAEYDFVCRNEYRGAAALAASYDGDYMSENWKSMLTAEEIALVNRTGEIRTMVKTEVWAVEPGSVLWAADADTKAKIFVFNYFSLPEGKDQDDHTKIEMDIWKPVHASRMKDGHMKGWLVLNLVMPRYYGKTIPYQCATIDAYADLTQLLAPSGGGNYFAKVHPTKIYDDVWKQTLATARIEKADVRMMIDRLAW
jgi:hypothetical protein